MFDVIRNWIYEKFSGTNHDNWYSVLNDGENAFGVADKPGDLLQYSFRHPILSGAMLFYCNLFAQAEFKITKLDGTLYEGKYNDVLKILNAPNFYQTRVDFLEALQWMKIARGYAAIYTPKRIGFDNEILAMYVLDPHRIKWPRNFKTPLSYKDDLFQNTTVEYIEDNDTNGKEIKLRDLTFIYDMPNILSPTNMFKCASRLDGLKQTLDNTVDSLIAKNIILKSNGKEMLSLADSNGFPLDDKEEKEAKRIFNINFGLSKTRDRAFLTKANVKWQSMHIALRDLGLDESTKVDGNIVYTALHIPKDILSLEAKKTTYNNFRESMTSFIQNDMTSAINDTALTLTQLMLPSNLRLVGTYDHLPVMGHLEKEKAEAANTKADALIKYLNTGMDPKRALELCGLDNNITIKPPKNEQTGQTESQEDQ